MMIEKKALLKLLNNKIESLDNSWLNYAPEDLRIRQAERNKLQNIKDEIEKIWSD